MKQLISVFLLIAVASGCSPKKDAGEATASDSVMTKVAAGGYLFQKDTVSHAVRASHEKLVGVAGDLKSFKKFISTLSDTSMISIALALDYIKTCTKATSKENDSILYFFNAFFFAVCNPINTTIDQRLEPWRTQLYARDFSAPELEYFKQNLENCGAGIFATEGMFYLDVLPYYFFDNFHDRVSNGIREYLALRAEELQQGFSEDGGMLISFGDLYQRVKNWEIYLKEYPENIYTTDAKGFLQTYLETLLTGMDNTRIFDFENNSLDPNVKMLYEQVIKENAPLRSTKVIADYYQFLGSRDFKGDSIGIFLTSHNLSTMLAVQPHNR